jgi:hypothetical protein
MWDTLWFLPPFGMLNNSKDEEDNTTHENNKARDEVCNNVSR